MHCIKSAPLQLIRSVNMCRFIVYNLSRQYLEKIGRFRNFRGHPKGGPIPELLRNVNVGSFAIFMWCCEGKDSCVSLLTVNFYFVHHWLKRQL